MSLIIVLEALPKKKMDYQCPSFSLATCYEDLSHDPQIALARCKDRAFEHARQLVATAHGGAIPCTPTNINDALLTRDIYILDVMIYLSI